MVEFQLPLTPFIVPEERQFLEDICKLFGVQFEIVQFPCPSQILYHIDLPEEEPEELEESESIQIDGDFEGTEEIIDISDFQAPPPPPPPSTITSAPSGNLYREEMISELGRLRDIINGERPPTIRERIRNRFHNLRNIGRVSRNRFIRRIIRTRNRNHSIPFQAPNLEETLQYANGRSTITNENQDNALTTLRDEMLAELERLRRIMRGAQTSTTIEPEEEEENEPLGGLREEMLRELDRLRRIMHDEPLEINTPAELESVMNAFVVHDGHIVGFGVGGINFPVIPKSITSLTRLQVLTLKNCGLESFPEIISELTSIQKLNLQSNHLRNLPYSLISLNNLNILNVSGNFFRDLPISVLKLPHLHSLDLSNNALPDIPREILQLKSLIKIDLEDNPFLSGIPDVNLTDLNDILPYLLRRELKYKKWNPDIIIQRVALNQPLSDVDRTYPEISKFYVYLEDKLLNGNLPVNGVYEFVIAFLKQKSSIHLGNSPYDLIL